MTQHFACCALCNQVFELKPPETWATAPRLIVGDAVRFVCQQAPCRQRYEAERPRSNGGPA